VIPAFQVVYSGRPAKIECKSEVVEYWSLNGNVVNFTYVKPYGLYIPAAGPEHDGKYVCNANLHNTVYQGYSILKVGGN